MNLPPVIDRLLKSRVSSRPRCRAGFRTGGRRSAPAWRQIESMEIRTLLAGNVLASLSNGTLSLTGDDSANTVAVTVSEGNVVVRGLSGTTINGAATDFVAVTGSSTIAGSLKISLGGGNDTAAVGAVTITGDLSFNGGSGDDVLGLKGTTLQGDLTSSDDNGKSSFSVVDSTINGSVDIEEAEVFSLKNSTVADDVEVGERTRAHGLFSSLLGLLGSLDRWGILNRLESHGVISRLQQARSAVDSRFGEAGMSNPLSSLLDGLLSALDTTVPAGDPSQIVLDDATVKGRVQIDLPNKGGNVVISDSTVEGSQMIRGGNAADLVNISSSTLQGYSNTSLGRGNDLLRTEGTNKFEGVAVALGGSGSDALQTSAGTTFDRPLQKFGFESSTVDAAAADARRTAAETAASTLATTIAGLLAPPAVPGPTALADELVFSDVGGLLNGI